jgi:hypothetical protein
MDVSLMHRTPRLFQDFVSAFRLSGNYLYIVAMDVQLQF